MNLSNKTGKFLIRAAFVLTLVLIAFSQIIFGISFTILVGLIIGYLISILRLIVLCNMAECIIQTTDRKNNRDILAYLLVHIVTIIAFIIAASISLKLFAAVAAGVLTVPLSITINSVTEFFGTTRNNFE
jgi:hypothetical protein